MKIPADERDAGKRADVFLSSACPELSRNAAQRLLEEGRVFLAGRTVRKNHRVDAGDLYEFELPKPEEGEAKAEEIPLDIVYEDEDVIVVNKPKGMVVHPAPGHREGTLVNALLHHCGASLSGIGGRIRPGIVHRIDRDTTGLIIAAKNDAAHNGLAAQLKDRTLSRTYEAVVTGALKDEKGIIDAPVGRNPSDRKKMAVTEKNSRPAVTRYEVIARYPGYTHVRCFLETGRTHQIRVHMAHIGHPVLGDAVYGRKKTEKGVEGQCLHARALKFLHPRTGEPVVLEAPLPDYFVKVLKKLENQGGAFNE